MKIVVGHKGKSYQIEIDNDKSAAFIGKKLGNSFSGDDIGLPGYEFKIKGGSDKQGFPLRPNVHGSKRIRPLLSPGIGFKGKYGQRRRRSIRGKMITEDVAQLNVKVVKEGAKPLSEIFKKEEVKEKKPEEKEEE